MNRLIFTRRNDDIISYTFDNDTPVEINLYNEESNILGNIYVGVVDNIVKNIVYSGSKSNVLMTMIGGIIRYENGKFNIGTEPEEIYRKAEEISKRLYS